MMLALRKAVALSCAFALALSAIALTDPTPASAADADTIEYQRIVGMVDAGGAPIRGTGFESKRTTTGHYEVTVDLVEGATLLGFQATAFYPPGVDIGHDSAPMAIVNLGPQDDGNELRMQCFVTSSAGGLLDAQFCFVADYMIAQE